MAVGCSCSYDLSVSSIPGACKKLRTRSLRRTTHPSADAEIGRAWAVTITGVYICPVEVRVEIGLGCTVGNQDIQEGLEAIVWVQR